MAKRSYKFTDKKHTKQGMASTGFGVAAFLLLGIGFWMAYQNAGAGGSVTGLLGLWSMLFSVVGFILGMKGFQEEDVYYLFSQIGVILNSVLFILWVLIFIVGM